MKENHVINTLTAIQYTLYTTHRKSTNHRARNTNAQNDIKFQSKRTELKQSAFRHSHNAQQLLSNSHSNNNFEQLPPQRINHSNIKSKFSLQNLFNRKVRLSTRGRPQIDTYSIPIHKRHRTPNKPKMEPPNDTAQIPIISIVTQTVEINNLDQGRNLLLSRQQQNPF